MKRIILIIGLLMVAVLVTAATPQVIRTLTLNAPIPDRYISSMEQSDYVVGITKDSENTYITVNITGLNSNQIGVVRDTYQRLQDYFQGLHSSNLMGMQYFEGQALPFACPKDVTTGVKAGLYLQNGLIVVDSGDTQERCP